MGNSLNLKVGQISTNKKSLGNGNRNTCRNRFILKYKAVFHYCHRKYGIKHFGKLVRGGNHRKQNLNMLDKIKSTN